jgi:sigma-54 specific flagellar transcriptional regulator A
LPDDGLDLRTHLYAIERALIKQALERSSGTVAHAARLLHLRRTTLVEKLRKFDMLTEGDAALIVATDASSDQNSAASEI